MPATTTDRLRSVLGRGWRGRQPVTRSWGPRLQCTPPSSGRERRRRPPALAWLRVSDQRVSCQFPLPGSYSSADALPPPATSTLPSGSRVAVWSARANPRLAVAVQVRVPGSYSSAEALIVVAAAEAADHEHLAIGQQRCRPAAEAGRDHLSDGRPGPAARVIHLGGGRCLAAAMGVAARHEHRPIGQGRRRVPHADPAHVPGDASTIRCSGRTARPWAFRSRGRSGGCPPRAPCHRATVLPWCSERSVSRNPVAVQVPVLGSYSSAARGLP